MRRRGALFAGIVGAAALGLSVPAQANHHLMSIREVFPGTGGNGFIELQMYASGQQVVSGQQLITYAPDGMVVDTFTFPGNPTAGGASAGASQRSILVGESGTAGTPDFTEGVGGLGMFPGAGAACFVSGSFGPIDCVSWGPVTGSVPSSAGSPASPGGVTFSKSLTRSIAPGCASLLESGDDTNDSSADFAETDPTPRNNGVSPTESSCPDTLITKKPKARTTDRTPKFEFASAPAGGTFECKLDDAPFAGCSSPYKPGKQSLGKHKLQARAELNGGEDPSPATHKWKIVKR